MLAEKGRSRCDPSGGQRDRPFGYCRASAVYWKAGAASSPSTTGSASAREASPGLLAGVDEPPDLRSKSSWSSRELLPNSTRTRRRKLTKIGRSAGGRGPGLLCLLQSFERVRCFGLLLDGTVDGSAERRGLFV